MEEKFTKSRKRSARPNIIIYNAVLNACAYTTGDLQETSRALEIAHSLLRELENSDYGKPDHVTYGTFIKVIANQMPDCDTRRQAVQVLFHKCCKDGQMSNFVLQQIRAITSESEEIYEKLTGFRYLQDINVGDLPSQWSSNAVDGKRRRRRQYGPKRRDIIRRLKEG